jgi:hypothetical protein
MRYNDVETITFRALNGKSYAVKDLREIPVQSIRKSIQYESVNTLDEIASRPEVYGEYAEDQTYKIFEANMVKIFDVRFDMTRIKRLDIPT